MRLPLLLLALAALAPPAHAQRRLVPEQYPTIQAAIDAAADGDTVLVRDGRYVENVTFDGKEVVVASYFLLDRDLAHVEATVIDGSSPASPDTGSVVRFLSGEGPGAVLEGFTLTGGTGTKWLDEHGAGTYQEGGGIIVALASPTIRYNRIVDNEAIRVCGGCQGAGGGGIRVGDGRPLIEHNVIADNDAMYGGGIVMNWTSGTIRNNVVVRNRVYPAVAGAPTFNGGGLWLSGPNPASFGPTVVEHNVIAFNDSRAAGGAGTAGGVLLQQTGLTVRHNIIWGNTQQAGPGWSNQGGVTLTNSGYNDSEGQLLNGTGNVSVDPLLDPATFALGAGSPAIDAGDPAPAANDPEGAAPGFAAPPAQGTVRADMGVYGGPYARTLADIPTAANDGPGAAGLHLRATPNPFAESVALTFELAAAGPVTARVYDVRGAHVTTLAGGLRPAGPQALVWDGRDAAGRPAAAGVYLYVVEAAGRRLTGRATLVR
jgi:hypothetical protein